MRPRFPTRNPDRDRQTDATRMARLQQTLSQFKSEIEAERNGFESRYRSASADAAFSQELVESGESDNGLSDRVEDLTNALINYSRRMTMLDKQIAYIGQLQENVEVFVSENGISDHGAARLKDAAS